MVDGIAGLRGGRCEWLSNYFTISLTTTLRSSLPSSHLLVSTSPSWTLTSLSLFYYLVIVLLQLFWLLFFTLFYSLLFLSLSLLHMITFFVEVIVVVTSLPTSSSLCTSWLIVMTSDLFIYCYSTSLHYVFISVLVSSFIAFFKYNCCYSCYSYLFSSSAEIINCIGFAGRAANTFRYNLLTIIGMLRRWVRR